MIHREHRDGWLDHTPDDESSDDWILALRQSEADVSKPQLPWSKIGKLATSLAGWIKNESTSEPDRLPDDQDRVEAVSLRHPTEIILAPEQREEVEDAASELTLAVAEVYREQLSDEILAEKLTTIEQPARDFVIKRALGQTVECGSRALLTKVTQFLTDHQLPLEDYDGLAETTALFLKNFSQSTADVDESPYAYFVNGAMNDKKVSQQIKLVLTDKEYDLASMTASISKNIIINKFKSHPRDTKNLVAFVKGLENVGIDIATNDFFIDSCIENSFIDDFRQGTTPLQENLYQAGLINDSNIKHLYYQLAKSCQAGMTECSALHGISLNICPDSEVTKYWRQFRRTSLYGTVSPSEDGVISEWDILSFRSLLEKVDRQTDNYNIDKYFKEGVPDRRYFKRLKGKPALTDSDKTADFIFCLADMPLVSEVRSLLGSSQIKSLDLYQEWEQKGASYTFFELAQPSDIDINRLVDLSRKADDFLGKYPLACLVDRSQVIDAHIKGKDAILGEEYFGDLVMYDSGADREISTMDDETIKQLRRHLDTLSRFDLFDGDRARMVNYAVLTENLGDSSQLFDELATVDELDEATRNSLNLVLRTHNQYNIKSVEELKNYRAVIAERATSDLTSDYVGDACRAISFIMLADFDGYDLSCFDLEALRQHQVLTADDEAVIELFRQVHPTNFGLEYDSQHDQYVPAEGSDESDVYNGKATERLLQIIAGSPLCIPVEDESGVAKITKIEGSASDLISKLRHYITDDWNKSLIDLEATGEGVEHFTIDEDDPGKALKVIKLTGAPFKMLSHTIYEYYNRPNIYNALIDDPSVWNTAQGSSTISTSCIDEECYDNYLQSGADPSTRVLLGFNHIQPSGIAAMAPSDGYLRGGLKLEMGGVLFTTCDQLMQQFDKISFYLDMNQRYNEVGLSRISSEPGARNGRLQPSHIIVHGSSTDGINENSKKFARYFDVPITLIDDEAYRKKYNVEPD
ncbi:hypothetical protein [Candidatus Nanoperiomorbus periodonticus]|uniref:hypothetical protein n=1 Tax=Candidatus Nanoperiomorbus periodonticus TaxID=2171989 RepID=UPI00101D6E0C|nr:hypothetical protein [Candidatus Nanoperiomorbus periodonticus]RYC75813.1 hypothetical protein G52EAM_00228 [Candidatus Nanoperiomorbus periodonticus]